MLFSRKAPDTSQRKQAFKVSDAIAKVLRDHLTWERYSMWDYYLNIFIL